MSEDALKPRKANSPLCSGRRAIEPNSPILSVIFPRTRSSERKLNTFSARWNLDGRVPEDE